MELRNLTVEWEQEGSGIQSKAPSFILEETVAERPSMSQEAEVHESH